MSEGGDEMLERNELVVGVDFGTQSLKVALYRTSGQQIWLDQERYLTHSYRDRAEQNPEDWWTAFCRVMRRLPDEVDRQQIRGLAVCATSSTVLLTDEQENPLMPAMLWMDQQAVKEAEHINGQSGETVASVLAYSGGKVSEEWMSAKSLWLKKQGLLRPGVRIMEQLDWIHFRLTQRWVASQCNATCKWNYIPQHGGFVKDFFQTIGFAEYLSYWPQEVLPVGERIGPLMPEAARALGLHTEVIVFQGGIDAHIGMLGTGAVEEGEMNLIMGSSFVHLLHADQPVWKQGLWGPYPDAILPDSWLLEGGQLTCGSLTTWFMEQFYSHLPHEEHANVYQQLVAKAEKLTPGSEGLVVLDSWQGNRTPYRDPYARGSIFGLTLTHKRSMGHKQIVEIVKALAKQAQIIVMDEPSTTLSNKEIETLFAIIDKLRRQGIAVVYISHKLEELFAVGDRVTVLRDGKKVMTRQLSALDQEELDEWITGEKRKKQTLREENRSFPPFFRVEGLRNDKIKNISFSCGRGEVVGLYGLVGSGRTETLRTIFGVDRLSAGQVFINEQPLSIQSPHQAIHQGIALVPENRKTEGGCTRSLGIFAAGLWPSFPNHARRKIRFCILH